jgi:hypothetical protein
LLGRDGFDHLVGVHVRRQRKLNQDAVDGWLLVQRLNPCQQCASVMEEGQVSSTECMPVSPQAFTLLRT